MRRYLASKVPSWLNNGSANFEMYHRVASKYVAPVGEVRVAVEIGLDVEKPGLQTLRWVMTVRLGLMALDLFCTKFRGFRGRRGSVGSMITNLWQV